MEKGPQDSTGKVIKIVITGPECTGKSTLSRQLAEHFHTRYIPEYAREYIAGLCRPYSYEDVLHIAEIQREQARSIDGGQDWIVFLDTYLIITKVWFEVVFNRCPDWIDRELASNKIDLYLLCDTSIPWTTDAVRENGGEMRERLFLMYKQELERLGCRFSLITGTGPDRLNSAIQAVSRFLEQNARE